LFDDVALILIVVSVVLFFQSEDLIIGFGMVRSVLALIIRSFLLLVSFFPLLLRACQIMVSTLLVASIILDVSVILILLVVAAVAVVASLIAASVILIVGICSPWILRVATFGI
jgi:hypothetical protein